LHPALRISDTSYCIPSLDSPLHSLGLESNFLDQIHGPLRPVLSLFVEIQSQKAHYNPFPTLGRFVLHPFARSAIMKADQILAVLPQVSNRFLKFTTSNLQRYYPFSLSIHSFLLQAKRLALLQPGLPHFDHLFARSSAHWAR